MDGAKIVRQRLAYVRDMRRISRQAMAWRGQSGGSDLRAVDGERLGDGRVERL